MIPGCGAMVGGFCDMMGLLQALFSYRRRLGLESLVIPERTAGLSSSSKYPCDGATGTMAKDMVRDWARDLAPYSAASAFSSSGRKRLV
jgi:hypothetical protein